MSSGPWKSRPNDLIRVLKAARKAGYSVDKAVINRAGDIALTFGEGNSANNDENPWDEVLTNAADEKRPS